MPYKNKEDEKEYQRKYHLRTWAKRKKRHYVLAQKRKAELITWFKLYKQKLYCQWCKEDHPACIDFHHENKNEKYAAIADMVQKCYSIESIKKEIKKCIILCRNCHAKLHFNARNNNDLG